MKETQKEYNIYEIHVTCATHTNVNADRHLVPFYVYRKIYSNNDQSCHENGFPPFFNYHYYNFSVVISRYQEKCRKSL